MSKIACHIGLNPVTQPRGEVTGAWTAVDGQPFYRITSADRLRPFLMSVVSASDLWMFISSTGALTAGRGNPDLALFPYYTEDKIHDYRDITGSKTLLLVQAGQRTSLWEPFSDRQSGIYRIQRNLYKNRWGNQLLFEERNEDLGLTFRYGWFMSERFGFVRRAWIESDSTRAVLVHLLDGLLNLMPCGAGSQFQVDKSTLLDAYKRNELLEPSGLGLFRLSSIPIDRPEPAESLRTNVVWCLGLARGKTLLSARQVDSFRQGVPLETESDVRGERGAYLIEAKVALRGKQAVSWMMGADVGQGPAAVAELDALLRSPDRLRRLVDADVKRGTRDLIRIVGATDGLQKTAWPMGDARHGNNALFNVMRGGIFADGYKIDRVDLGRYLAVTNRTVAAEHEAFLKKLKPGVTYAETVALAKRTGDAQLERLCREYLPLTFSRRHGDPSRPWNRFSIVTKAADGSKALHYEGNWRDIFQNWEALAVSFPGFLPGMISRFLGASTADGYNPYRITRDGIDWEVVDPHDPWAHIGYWGDHQLIYLLKLLEILEAEQPGLMREFLVRELFAYANVPYRIKPYANLLANPKDTVTFAQDAEQLVRERVAAVGSDGKLVQDKAGQVRLANLTEKLLVAILAKLSNFIPDAGIWLNTQRPEWNDANNALVGNGVSVVTLCHLRRYLTFCKRLFEGPTESAIQIASEVESFLSEIDGALETHRPLLDAPLLDDGQRRKVLDALGGAGGRYRKQMYSTGFSGESRSIATARIREFMSRALEWVDHSIRANRRSDGLYHSYNLVRLDQAERIGIRRLYEMLEGQVAVLASGLLEPGEALVTLQALRASAMYRKDQHSYMLYPNRSLPRFTEQNMIPANAVRGSALLSALVRQGDRSLIEKDLRGRFHFNGTITNAEDVRRILERLGHSTYQELVGKESTTILGIFECVFDHESFTGRSGTFFAYEGLGSIYWHMVSKLLLAVQETHRHASESGSNPEVVRALAACYEDIRKGLGDWKAPVEYGAFPADPYSHTPAHTGARQPGLTGQVKEDFLCRMGELGVEVRNGTIRFDPRLLRVGEFLTEAAGFEYLDVTGTPRTVGLDPGCLGFTYCQVPVVYVRVPTGERRILVHRAKGGDVRAVGHELDPATTRSILARDGSIRRITVQVAIPD